MAVPAEHAVEPHAARAATSRTISGQHQQHDAQRAGRAPVEEDLDVVGDAVGDHDHLAAAQHRRRHVEAEAEDEDDQRAGEQARQRQREEHRPERARRAGAEVGRGLEVVAVDRPHRAVERQHQERQHDVHHADQRAGEVVHQRAAARPTARASCPRC